MEELEAKPGLCGIPETKGRKYIKEDLILLYSYIII